MELNRKESPFKQGSYRVCMPGAFGVTVRTCVVAAVIRASGGSTHMEFLKVGGTVKLHVRPILGHTPLGIVSDCGRRLDVRCLVRHDKVVLKCASLSSLSFVFVVHIVSP